MRRWMVILGILIALVLVPACTTTTQNDNLTIVTEEYPPFNFVGFNNTIVGQSTEIVQAILKSVGIPASIEVMNWSEAYNLALKGTNVMLYSIDKTPQREALFKWVGPIGTYEKAFYVRRGNTINIGQLEDAKKVDKISVYKDDAGQQFLASSGFTNLDINQNDTEALKKLIDGKVQLWLGNREGLWIIAEKAGINPDEVIAIKPVTIKSDIYMAFSKDISDATVAKWQSALDSLKKASYSDGKTYYDLVVTKYSNLHYIKSLLKEQ
jgi:polar amino acid transport system substrate-binding protein